MNLDVEHQSSSEHPSALCSCNTAFSGDKQGTKDSATQQQEPAVAQTTYDGATQKALTTVDPDNGGRIIARKRAWVSDGEDSQDTSDDDEDEQSASPRGFRKRVKHSEVQAGTGEAVPEAIEAGVYESNAVYNRDGSTVSLDNAAEDDLRLVQDGAEAIQLGEDSIVVCGDFSDMW